MWIVTRWNCPSKDFEMMDWTASWDIHALENFSIVWPWIKFFHNFIFDMSGEFSDMSRCCLCIWDLPRTDDLCWAQSTYRETSSITFGNF